VVIGVIGVAAVAAALSAQAQTAAETVFVMTNAASRNEVIAYKQSPDGKFYEANRYAAAAASPILCSHKACSRSAQTIRCFLRQMPEVEPSRCSELAALPCPSSTMRHLAEVNRWRWRNLETWSTFSMLREVRSPALQSARAAH
jgi:hypothetical protein